MKTMNPQFSQQSSRSRKLISLFTDRNSDLSQNQQNINNYGELSTFEAEQKAKQSLLSIEQSHLPQISNPQRNFMKLTRNLKFNSSPENIQFQGFSFIDQQNDNILVKRSKLKRNKQSTLSQQNSKRNLLRLNKAIVHDDKSIGIVNKFINDSPTKQIDPVIVKANSNLLTPRTCLPSLYSSENQYVGLKKRTKSSLKPYSFQKAYKNIRVMSVIKFKEDLATLSIIQKQLRKNKLFGYD